MKKLRYTLSLLTMSMATALPVIADSSSSSIFSSFVSDSGIGIHYDIGLQVNMGYSSTRYVDTTYDATSESSLEAFSKSTPIEINQGPIFSPGLFAGIRFYYTDKSFIGFHIGDIFIHKELFRFNYDDYRENDAFHTVNSKLTSRNTLYGKLSWGYFITPDIDINVSALGVYDHYRLTYHVDGVEGGELTNFDSLQRNKKFGGSGYGLGLGIERYLSDRIILSLNYTFIQHNSKTKMLEETRFDAADSPIEINPDIVSRINFRHLHENIMSLGLTFEI